MLGPTSSSPLSLYSSSSDILTGGGMPAEAQIGLRTALQGKAWAKHAHFMDRLALEGF